MQTPAAVDDKDAIVSHPHPDCYPDEASRVAADLLYKRAKATFHARNDARALNDQIMLQVMLREVA